MKKWEHMLLSAPELGFGLVKDLNKFGEEGFEAVGFVTDSLGAVNVLLKREVPEQADQTDSRKRLHQGPVPITDEAMDKLFPE